ncbi:uncharacterized protein LOC119100284 [Pollicipes pollicipes]|uniref:uncharacterized protein LOC119100284 n=1 Tax=Pollicipes pollicipes TaxID=41117 RepID=UPI00188578DF|nr:uncharacterized protein LOC119100284 [Pollicipes pollicipes]
MHPRAGNSVHKEQPVDPRSSRVPRRARLREMPEGAMLAAGRCLSAGWAGCLLPAGGLGSLGLLLILLLLLARATQASGAASVGHYGRPYGAGPVNHLSPQHPFLAPAYTGGGGGGGGGSALPSLQLGYGVPFIDFLQAQASSPNGGREVPTPHAGAAGAANVSLPVLPHSIPVTGQDYPDDGCARDEVRLMTTHRSYHQHQPCQRILEQGYCPLGQWVVVNMYTRRGECATQLCPDGYAFVEADGLCHDVYEQGLCPGKSTPRRRGPAARGERATPAPIDTPRTSPRALSRSATVIMTATGGRGATGVPSLHMGLGGAPAAPPGHHARSHAAGQQRPRPYAP